MYKHVKTGCKHIPPSEQPLQFQSGYFLNKPRINAAIEYRSADKFLVRPRRKQATATEDFDFHKPYL